MNDEIVLCSAKIRWSGCLLNKNLCCGYCDQLEECLKNFKIDSGNKIKPCNKELAEDCEFREFL